MVQYGPGRPNSASQPAPVDRRHSAVRVHHLPLVGVAGSIRPNCLWSRSVRQLLKVECGDPQRRRRQKGGSEDRANHDACFDVEKRRCANDRSRAVTNSGHDSPAPGPVFASNSDNFSLEHSTITVRYSFDRPPLTLALLFLVISPSIYRGSLGKAPMLTIWLDRVSRSIGRQLLSSSTWLRVLAVTLPTSHCVVVWPEICTHRDRNLRIQTAVLWILPQMPDATAATAGCSESRDPE